MVDAPKSEIRLSVALERRLGMLFFGTSQFAIPSLRLLHKNGWPIVAVVTAPDKPFGRNKILTPSPIKVVATELGLPVHTPASLKDEDFWIEFDALKPDICIVVAYGKIIPERYLVVPRLGFVNVHPSLLPEYRGPSPIASAILDGKTQTGVSIMLLDALQDHGPVIATTPWNIPGGFEALLCEQELSRIGAQLLVDTLPGYANGSITPEAQDDSRASSTKKFLRNDGRLDWSQSAGEIVNRIRALGSNPGTWTTWNGKVLNILEATADTLNGTPTKPGSVTRVGDRLLVATGKGSIVLERLQLEGSTKQSARDFYNGHPSIVDGMLE